MNDEINQILSASQKGLTDEAVAGLYGVTARRVRYLRVKSLGKRATGPKRGKRHSAGAAMLSLTILADLRDKPNSTYFAIARDRKVSREYVSQVAAQARRAKLLNEQP